MLKSSSCDLVFRRKDHLAKHAENYESIKYLSSFIPLYYNLISDLDVTAVDVTYFSDVYINFHVDTVINFSTDTVSNSPSDIPLNTTAETSENNQEPVITNRLGELNFLDNFSHNISLSSTGSTGVRNSN